MIDIKHGHQWLVVVVVLNIVVLHYSQNGTEMSRKHAKKEGNGCPPQGVVMRKPKERRSQIIQSHARVIIGQADLERLYKVLIRRRRHIIIVVVVTDCCGAINFGMQSNGTGLVVLTGLIGLGAKIFGLFGSIAKCRQEVGRKAGKALKDTSQGRSCTIAFAELIF